MTADDAPGFGTATLTDCDREPIHLPGAIQAHGVLLVLSEPDLVIRQLSSNLRRHLELNADRMLGRELSLVLDDTAMQAVRTAMAEELTEPRYLPPLTTNTGPRMEALIHRTAAGLLLELEPFLPEPGLDMPQLFRRMLASVHAAPTTIAAASEAVRHLRAITGFDRVMLYRFRADHAGVVIAEDRHPEMEPFLGLHYPASDIPAQARRLFALNPLRVWTTTDGEAAALVPALSPANGEPLDMSRCVLRAASPIHLEYLRNMGVGAALTLSIVRDGALWGLIACHHRTARRVPHAQRIVCESLGHLLTVQIETKEREERAATMARLQNWTVRTLGGIGTCRDLGATLRTLGPRMMGFAQAAGAAVHLGGRTETFGQAPSTAQVAALAGWLGTLPMQAAFATHRLRDQAGAAADELPACGLLAVRASSQPGDYLMWFRPEVAQTVMWAGDPTKPMASGPLGDRLTPRGSFAAWAETVSGTADPWSAAEMEAAQALQLALHEIVVRPGDEAADGRVAQSSQGPRLEEIERRLAEAALASQTVHEHMRQLVASLQSLAEGLRRE